MNLSKEKNDKRKGQRLVNAGSGLGLLSVSKEALKTLQDVDENDHTGEYLCRIYSSSERL